MKTKTYYSKKPQNFGYKNNKNKTNKSNNYQNVWNNYAFKKRNYKMKRTNYFTIIKNWRKNNKIEVVNSFKKINNYRKLRYRLLKLGISMMQGLSHCRWISFTRSSLVLGWGAVKMEDFRIWGDLGLLIMRQSREKWKIRKQRIRRSLIGAKLLNFRNWISACLKYGH